MMVLDTNVILEIMLPMPAVEVIHWTNSQPQTSIWTTSINVYEVLSAVQSMPAGRKRSVLTASFERWLTEVIQERIFSFDRTAAQHAANLTAARKVRGRPIVVRDTIIAGIVLASHATLATRNVKRFEEIAPSVVNPWEA